MMSSLHRWFLLLVLVSATVVRAQIPCDDQYGMHCPEESGWGVGECLKKLGPESIEGGCSEYIRMMDECRPDIDAHCSGKEYTSDALVCLTEWIKDVTLSDACVNALPEKKESHKTREADKLGSDAKRKADQRRRCVSYPFSNTQPLPLHIFTRIHT